MSDTPRTDAMAKQVKGMSEYDRAINFAFLCRKLELELIGTIVAARRFSKAERALSRKRLTSCGKTLEYAEQEFTDASFELDSVLKRMELTP